MSAVKGTAALPQVEQHAARDPELTLEAGVRLGITAVVFRATLAQRLHSRRANRQGFLCTNFSQYRMASTIHPSALVPVPSPKP
jgi:hypothetical protein